MEQEIGSEASGDPAAVAFEALRREVALLNVAVAGLAAERAAAPDYSETLGEISKGLSVLGAQLGRVMTSPALALSPAEVGRQITAAGEEVRRQERAALQRAQDGLHRATGDLEGWIDRARLASAQNWRLLQVTVAGLLAGAVLGVLLPGAVARAAPERWAWPEKMAAHVLRRELWLAGEQLLRTADARKWQDGRDGAAIIARNRDSLARCAREARPARRPSRCVIELATEEASGALADPRPSPH